MKDGEKQKSHDFLNSCGSYKNLEFTANKEVSTFPLLQKILGKLPSLSHFPAVRYEKLMEIEAKEIYEQVVEGQGHIDLEVRNCRLFIDSNKKYLAANPDLVASCACVVRA